MVPKWAGSRGISVYVSEEYYHNNYGDYSKQIVLTETVVRLIYRYRFGDPEEPRYVLHFGSIIHLQDALIPMSKLDISNMAVYMSYDVNTFQLRNASYGRGGYEIALSYENFNNKDNSSRNAVRCPVFYIPTSELLTAFF